MLQDTAIVTEQ